MIVVDRIEKPFVIIEEDSVYKEILLTDVVGYTNLTDGVILKRTASGYEIDCKNTEIRREKLRKKLNSLFKKGDGVWERNR